MHTHTADADDLNTQQLATLLNRPRTTISWWLRTGRITGAYKDGAHWRIPRKHAQAPVITREPSYPKRS